MEGESSEGRLREGVKDVLVEEEAAVVEEAELVEVLELEVLGLKGNEE